MDTEEERQISFLLLEGIFDENTVNSFLTISPATNFWLRGFIDSLLRPGHHVDVIGYPVERVWPFGRLMIRRQYASLAPGLKGVIVGYLNIPFFRSIFQYINLRNAVKKHLYSSGKKPDYQIVYSCIDKSTDQTPSIRMAKYIRKHFGVPWICIVADGAVPFGADGYVYLPWSNYQLAKEPAIHIDGGILSIDCTKDQNSTYNDTRYEKVLMYMGALTEHGGVSQLARAFSKINDKDIQLWICGRGKNSELENLAEMDQRIKLKGFIGEIELNKLASAAFAFVNPRPGSFSPNKFNYPSKLLRYLAYGKPIISTITEGMSPDYVDVLIPIGEESDDGLSEAISSVLSMSDIEYQDMLCRIKNFNKTHTWSYQVNRFISWVQNDIKLC